MGRNDSTVYAPHRDVAFRYELYRHAGIDLFYFQERHGGMGFEATQDYLNHGILQYLFEKFAFQGDRITADGVREGKDWKAIYICALAMRVGAAIEPASLELIKAIVKESLTIHPSQIRDMELALRFYRPGTVYVFGCARCERWACDELLFLDEWGCCPEPGLLKCDGCTDTYYCNWECQKRVEEQHMRSCKGAPIMVEGLYVTEKC